MDVTYFYGHCKTKILFLGFYGGVITPIKTMEKKEAEKMTDIVVEIFESNNEKLSGDRNTNIMNYLHCLAKLN